jgi:hypothetical protein
VTTPEAETRADRLVTSIADLELDDTTLSLSQF